MASAIVSAASRAAAGEGGGLSPRPPTLGVSLLRLGVAAAQAEAAEGRDGAGD